MQTVFYKSSVASAMEREQAGEQGGGNGLGVNGHTLVFLLSSLAKTRRF